MTLDKVCQAFEDWRSKRRSRKERIPAHLWVMVRELLPHYQRSTICRALHLSGGQFKHQCLEVQSAEEQAVAENDGFVAAWLPPPTADCELTLQGARKTLSIKIPSQKLSVVLPLLEAYL